MDSPDRARVAGSRLFEMDAAAAAVVLLKLIRGEGTENPGDGAGISPSIFCFLRASACRLGGPRRLLGLLYVQGISKLAQDRHGGPLSSHYQS
jgi:hypothetical protein